MTTKTDNVTCPANRLLAAMPGVMNDPAWLHQLRGTGRARFAKLGFPTTRDEDWRFTSVAPITELNFMSPSADADAQLGDCLFGGLEGPRLVFVNGHYSRELSVVADLPNDVKVGNVAGALAQNDRVLQIHMAHRDTDAFASLNSACFTDGAFINLPEGVVMETPIRIYHLNTAGDGATTNIRSLIVVGSNSKATIIESWNGSNAAYFNNAITELIAGDNARVEHVKFQDESTTAFHVGGLHMRMGRDSRASHHSIALGGRVARNNIRAHLDGTGLETVLNGLYLPRGGQLIDHHMVVDHALPHGISHEYFNGILDDQARGVFHGRIHVHKGADKTDARQTNKNLLLSEDATVDTKPQLEIYADDVKCTHGATVGQMNPEQIFYLRARGLSEESARRMIMHAFAGEIIERIACEPVREELDRLMQNRLEE
jgi:Fe-S cluster assembly protein SufD